MERKNNSDYIGFYESVTAIIKNYKDYGDVETEVCVLDRDYEFDECLKFQDVLDCCKLHGYKEGHGTILLILENYTKGEIYRYGNYGDDKWYRVGEMVGFA